MQYKTAKKNQEEKTYTLYILSTSFDNLMILAKACIRYYNEYKMAIMITVECILAQRKISTIGMIFFVEMKKTRAILFRYFLSC